MTGFVLGAVAAAATALVVLLVARARLSAARAELTRVREESKASTVRYHLLEAAVGQVEELVAILSPDFRIELANDALYRAVGRERPALDDTDFRTLLAGESRAAFAEAVAGARDARVWRGSHTHERHDGSTFPAAVAVVAVRDGAGAADHLVLIERDITEESRLRDQLIHTERLSAVGQLVSGVAHELNNPLQAILGFAELMIETQQGEQNLRDLRQVRAEAVRAGKIIRNLLAFVRRSSVERMLADVNDLLRATVALRAYEFGGAGIVLEERYGDDVPPVWVNREEVQQVLLNLILNAEQAMRGAHQDGTLTVETRAVGASVVVDVRDTGPGVPSRLLGRVFEPFFSTKGVGEGTGLGLSIALGIAEAHGGLLSIVPTPSGACFRLTLPASRPVPSANASAEPARRALIADDDPGVRATLQNILTERGLTVDLAVDGEAAVSLLATHHYDLMFCGVRLPKMGGLALYTRISDDYGELAGHFAFIASQHLDAESLAIMERGRVPVLARPLSVADVDETIGRLRAAPLV